MIGPLDLHVVLETCFIPASTVSVSSVDLLLLFAPLGPLLLFAVVLVLVVAYFRVDYLYPSGVHRVNRTLSEIEEDTGIPFDECKLTQNSFLKSSEPIYIPFFRI